MNKYGKVILAFLFLAGIIGGSSFLYGKLSAQYNANNISEIAPGNPTSDATAGDAGTDDAAGDESMAGDATAGDAGTDGAAGDESTPGDATSGDAGTDGAAGDESPMQTAPDFVVVDGTGEEVSLSDFFGKPIVLNFWASWCGPCKSEMPMFQEMYDIYGEEVQFLIVNLTDGSRETTETASAYIGEQGYTFPVYYDVNQEAAYTYYVSSIPATYFIDADGNLAAYGQGAMNADSFMRGLEILGVEAKQGTNE